MSDQQVLYLSRADVESVNLPMQEIISLLKKLSWKKEMARLKCPQNLESIPCRMHSSMLCLLLSRPCALQGSNGLVVSRRITNVGCLALQVC